MKIIKRSEVINSNIALLSQMLEEQVFEQYPHSRTRLINILDSLNSGSYLNFSPVERVRFDNLIERIEKDYENYRENPDDRDRLRKRLMRDVYYIFVLCSSANTDTTEFNTETYFKKTISELEEKISKLEAKQLESKQPEDQKEKIQQELEEKKGQLEQIKGEKEELEKKLDAQENLKGKISQAFVELRKHIKPLKEEKRRLNYMFGIYAFLCVCVLGLLLYFEYKYLLRWVNIESDKIKLIDYLPFYIPVPIVGGLLWVFLYQMNRAQRQLMVLANVLYHVDYIEGLLLAINMISPTVAAASEKISQVLDNLIRNYISIPNEQFERSLDKEISKDTINVDTFIDLAKKVKDVIK